MDWCPGLDSDLGHLFSQLQGDMAANKGNAVFSWGHKGTKGMLKRVRRECLSVHKQRATGLPDPGTITGATPRRAGCWRHWFIRKEGKSRIPSRQG